MKILKLLLTLIISNSIYSQKEKTLYDGSFKIIESYENKDTINRFEYKNKKLKISLYDETSVFELMGILNYYSSKNNNIESVYVNKHFKMYLHLKSDLIYIKDLNDNEETISKLDATNIANEIKSQYNHKFKKIFYNE